MKYTKEQEFKTALIRLLTGIKGKNFKGCIWYEGILADAEEEAIEMIDRR